ncbi:hypothetical protein FSP39_020041 [Pinctada imbricata]|uniref:Flavin-containing monooxygenase n=1 Tax=Pinctada imbricata TaxID=66713 RepID=A0AA89BNZ6_PINIB|nr:hypothetical protein FSP39_020041 [Pinctada imbricata]
MRYNIVKSNFYNDETDMLTVQRETSENRCKNILSPKRIAVIGVGASGLTAIKCCLDEGLEPVCFERTDHIGGLWYYTDSAVDGQACVMKSTVINTSKEMMCYSDFPIPKEYPIFMHNSYVLKYFNLYCKNFGLKKYIKFKTMVVSLRKRPDFASSGQWDIQIRNRDSGEKQDLVFDAVMICTGHHAEKNMPTFPSLDKFKGKVIHSNNYKDSRGYEDKRIVVVGIGNSCGDAAVELSRVASQGDVKLPTSQEMWDDIHFKSDAMAKRYVKSQRHTIQVDYVDYMDEIAEIGGNKPDLYALLKKDPKLALRCFFGACTPYQYRLMGPNSWTGAREAIMTQWDRTCYPLKTRPLGFEIEKSQLKFFFIYFLFIAMFAFIVHYLFMS